jgi:hypothetical protein
MMGLDADYGMMRAYDSMGWPRFMVIDREGTIQFHGFPDDSRLSNVRRCLDKLMRDDSGGLSAGLVLKDGVCYPEFAVTAREATRDRSPRLALDPAGNPHVVYFSNRSGANVVYLRRPEGSGGSSDEPLTPRDADCYAPDCAFDSTGKLWVVWCGSHGDKYDVYVQVRKVDEAVGETRLTYSEDDAMRPRIATDAQGRVAVAYYKWRKMRGVSRDRDIFARVFDPTAGSWSEEREISPHDPEVEDHTDPDVVIDRAGAPWVVWSYDYHPQLFDSPFDTDQPSVFAARLSQQGTVSPPILVGTVGVDRHAIDLFPSVAIDGDGILWCVYDQFSWRGTGRSIYIARLDNGDFGSAQALSTQGAMCSTPELSAGRDGTLIASWSERSSGRWRGKVAVVKGGKRVAETVIDEGTADVLFPQACQGPDGRIWLVYERSENTGAQVILEDLTDRMSDKGD